MHILDCETIESTKYTLSELLGISEANLVDSLFNQDYSKNYYASHDTNSISISQFIYKTYIDKHRLTPQKADKVYFFHLTRAIKKEDFLQGIKPLGLVLPDLLEMLSKISGGALDKEMCMKSLQNNCNKTLALRLQNSEFHGPNAIFIKQFAFMCKDLNFHNYLESSEAVENICNSISNETGFDLLIEYKRSTKPMILKIMKAI